MSIKLLYCYVVALLLFIADPLCAQAAVVGELPTIAVTGDVLDEKVTDTTDSVCASPKERRFWAQHKRKIVALLLATAGIFAGLMGIVFGCRYFSQNRVVGGSEAVLPTTRYLTLINLTLFSLSMKLTVQDLMLNRLDQKSKEMVGDDVLAVLSQGDESSSLNRAVNLVACFLHDNAELDGGYKKLVDGYLIKSSSALENVMRLFMISLKPSEQSSGFKTWEQFFQGLKNFLDAEFKKDPALQKDLVINNVIKVDADVSEL